MSKKEFDTFIEKITKNKGLNKENKENLKYEIQDHLLMLKDEYLKKGYSEKIAIKLALKSFGENNDILDKSIGLMDNRIKDFSIKHMILMFLGMNMFYIVLASIFMLLKGDFSKWGVYENIANIIILIIITHIINSIVNNKKNIIKNILINSFVYWISIKVLMPICIYFVYNNIYTNALASIPFKIDFYNIMIFIATIIICILITYFYKVKNDIKDKIVGNTINRIIKILFFLGISCVLMLIYYLIPNRCNIIRRILISLINNDIKDVSKNILFMTINKWLIIPNIGFYLITYVVINNCIKFKSSIMKKLEDYM